MASYPIIRVQLRSDKTSFALALIAWEKALAAADDAKAVIDTNAVDEPTRRRVEQASAGLAAAKWDAEKRAAAASDDEQLKAELQKLSFSQLQLRTVTDPRGGPKLNLLPGLANAEFERVFRAHGIDPGLPEEAGARIRASAIKPELIAALDAWIPLRPDESGRRALADLANRLSAPDDFHRQLRDALVKRDHNRLGELARRDLSALPPHVLYSSMTCPTLSSTPTRWTALPVGFWLELPTGLLSSERDPA